MKQNVKVAKELVKLAKSLIDDSEKYYDDDSNDITQELNAAEARGDKYILGDTGSYFHRVIACKDFSDVKKRDIGGLIDLSSTLSQEGNCWIYDDATVKEGAKIYNNAKIKDCAVVGGMKCQVSGDAIVSRCDVWDCEISGKAYVDYDVEDKEITE